MDARLRPFATGMPTTLADRHFEAPLIIAPFCFCAKSNNKPQKKVRTDHVDLVDRLDGPGLEGNEEIGI